MLRQGPEQHDVTYETGSALNKWLDYIISKGRSQPKLFHASLDRNNSFWKLETDYLIFPLVMELIDHSSTDGFKKQHIHLQKKWNYQFIFWKQINLISFLMLNNWWNERMDV